MHKIWTSFNSDNSSCFLAHDSVNQNKSLAKKLPTKNNICQNNNQPNGQSKATCNNHKKSFKMAINQMTLDFFENNVANRPLQFNKSILITFNFRCILVLI